MLAARHDDDDDDDFFHTSLSIIGSLSSWTDSRLKLDFNLSVYVV